MNDRVGRGMRVGGRAPVSRGNPRPQRDRRGRGLVVLLVSVLWFIAHVSDRAVAAVGELPETGSTSPALAPLDDLMRTFLTERRAALERLRAQTTAASREAVSHRE